MQGIARGGGGASGGRARAAVDAVWLPALVAVAAAGALPVDVAAQATLPPAVTGLRVIEVSPPAGGATEGGAVAAPPAPGVAAGAAPPAPADPAKPAHEERLEKFLQTKFDRRPSAVLETWGIPEPEPEPEPGSGTGQEEPSAGGGSGAPGEGSGEGEEKPEPTPAQLQTEAIAAEIAEFSEAVTLGAWDEVRDFLDGEFEGDGKGKAYQHLVTSLGQPPQIAPAPGSQPVPPEFAEQNVLLPGDVLGLADASPVELDDAAVGGLAALLARALEGGDFTGELVSRLDSGTRLLGGEGETRRKLAAKLLIRAGRAPLAGPFLPDPDDAAGDHEALDLLAQFHLAQRFAEDGDGHLATAWRVNARLLEAEGAPDELRRAALARAVELAPQVDGELGRAWLERSFTTDSARGMEVLAAIGAAAASARGQQDAELRRRKLELQATAVRALLEFAPERAAGWSDKLDLLAAGWLAEAEFTYQHDQSAGMDSLVQYDNYGNMYYEDPYRFINQNRNNRMPQPIPTAEVLEVGPGAGWHGHLDPSLAPKVDLVTARLRLKSNDEEGSFPHLERIAATYPEAASDLADEFIRVWARNHDPNNARRRTSPYFYYYGYSQRADAIPLTRSKQARNLEELAGWVEKLAALPIGGIDEEVLAQAFVTTHSSAEVYRLEDIEKVFGATDKLGAPTLARLLQTMRSNLATLWRDPEIQNNAGTKRKDREIQAEVARGYQVADAVLAGGLERFPDSWELELARAAIRFDQNNYHRELGADSGFATRKAEAFEGFAHAARLYSATVPGLAEEDESTEVYNTWFYASLGASDLGAIKPDQTADSAQQAAVKAAIEALPGAAAERHMARFANDLSMRISSVNAALKNRYLGGGLSVCGDHEKAAEARKIFDYYQDLVTEIVLEARVDGSTAVGHGTRFGLAVDLRHTAMIEREAGGFQKYLTNQNNNPYAYNYGRPTENYRDKFEDSARETLSEHFDVISVTFHSEKIESRGTGRDGWRVTPYAYLLLKARGPEVDAVPPLRMDLDFLDTSGYAVLPVASARIPVDAGPEAGDPRPYSKLTLTQTLDERRSGEGVLGLEIKAVAHGLVPELGALLDLEFGQFELESTDDSDVAVVRIDAGGEPVSERLWTLGLRAVDGLAALPTEFAFPQPLPGTGPDEVVYQRYDDADMALAGPVVALEAEYGEVESAPAWVPWAIGALALAVAGGGWLWWRRLAPAEDESPAFAVPDDVTPFSVVALLRRIQRDSNGGLGAEGRMELESAIGDLERRFFREESDPTTGSTGDLRKLAESWVRRAE